MGSRKGSYRWLWRLWTEWWVSRNKTGLDEKRNSDSIARLGEVGVDGYTKRRMKTEYNGESNAFCPIPSGLDRPTSQLGKQVFS